MENLQEIKNLERELRTKISQTWARITGIEEGNINIVSDDFISINAQNIDDVKKVMTTLDPFKNGWKIDHKDTVYLTSDYMVRIKNSYYNRVLNFEFELDNGLKFWINIDFKNLPSDFVEKFTTKTLRGLYETEEVYVNIKSHLKEFKEIRVECYRFNAMNLNWYGGDQTLIDEFEIKSIVEFIKS